MNAEQERIERANKWLAEKCGVDVVFKHHRLFMAKFGINKYKGYKPTAIWTIEDPRCREIVRERFVIETERDFDGERYAAIYWQPYIEEYGKTIAEAEIACILSIVEQEEG